MTHIFKQENYYIYSFPALKQKLAEWNQILYVVLLMQRMPPDL